MILIQGIRVDTEDDSVLKVGNDSISTYHLANTEMCHLNSAFIQEEKIVSLQISDSNVALSHDGKDCFSSYVISILAYFENSQDGKCITSATPVLDSVSHDAQLSFGNDSISEPLNSLQNKVFTEHADHIIGIDNSSHTQEWLKIVNVSELSDIQVNAVHKMLLGENSNETDDKTDHNTEDEHLKQGIGLLKQCDFSPDSIKDLQYNDLILKPLIDYLEKGTLPKLQREARRLILRSADYIVINSLLYHRRNAKCRRTFDHKPKYQLVLPKILIKPVLEIFMTLLWDDTEVSRIQ